MSETAIRFKLETSPHGLPSVSARGLPFPRLRAVLSFVRNSLIDSMAYKAKEGVSPFIQSLGEHDGWIMVEFWSRDTDKIQAYIALLNNELTRPLAEWETEDQ
jgi:hypothetical protein